jgi:hypothetical protein
VTNSVLPSAPAVISITASTCSQNPPVIHWIAGSVPNPHIGTNLQLSAQVDDQDNTDACGNLGETFTYKWSLANAPAGSTARLNDPALINPTLRPDLAGDYTVQLVVTDSTNLSSAPANATLHVAPCGAAPLTWPANAVTISNTSPRLGTLVTFTPAAVDTNTCGAAVTISYRWAILNSPTGSKAQLSSATDRVPAFIPDLNGSYQFSVVATDSLGNTSPVQYFTLTTSTCGQNPPVIASLASTVQSPRIGSLVQFTAVVSDLDGTSACGNIVETFA